MKKIIIILGLLQLSTSCDTKNDQRLMIHNRSNQEIIIMKSLSYPDTVNYIISNCDVYPPNADIYAPGETDIYSLFGTKWESVLEKLESQTMMLFIYDLDTVKHYKNLTGDCSMLNGKELKRVDVTMDYLHQNNFTITYP